MMMKAKRAKGKEKVTETSPCSEIQNSISELFAQIKKYDRKSGHWLRLAKAVTLYLAKDMISF